MQEADEGFKIEVVATATNANGVQVSATSAATALVLDAAPTITTPIITGTAQEGDTLTVSASAGQSDNSVSYQWIENDGSGGSYENIAGATGVDLPGAGGRRGLQDRGGGDGDQCQRRAGLGDQRSDRDGPGRGADDHDTDHHRHGAGRRHADCGRGGAGQSDNTVTYQWLENDGSGGSYVNIAGATGSSYQVQEADEGFKIEVVATATNDNGATISATSAATALVLDAAPTVTTPIITGTAEVGLVLTAAATAGQSDNTVSYQWLEDSGSGGSYVAISGATGASYQVQPNDNGLQIEVQATVINDNGTTVSATSAATAPVIGSNFLTLPSNSASTFEGTALALTNGHVVDSVPGDVVTLNLSVADGTLTPIDTTLPAGVTLDSESAAALQVHGTAAGINTLLTDGVTYTPNPNFTGSDTLTVAVSATSGATASEQVAITINPINVTAVTISGAAQEGQTLTADASSNDSGATFHYQWESSSNNFQTFTTIGTDSATYVVQESDEGNAIRVVASSADPENNVTSSLASTATALVLDAAPTITTPVISGTAQEGDTLTAAASAGQSDNSVSYQWLENDGSGGSYVNIAGATGASYQVQEADEGFKIEVVATATNDNGATISATSAATALVLDAAPTITTPVISGTAQEGDTLTAAASAGQSDNSVSYQWLENDGSGGSYVNIAGATGASYQVQEADEGFKIEVVATATNANGMQVSATSAATALVLDAAPTITTPIITGTAQEGDTLTAAASAGQSDNSVSYSGSRTTAPAAATRTSPAPPVRATRCRRPTRASRSKSSPPPPMTTACSVSATSAATATGSGRGADDHDADHQRHGAGRRHAHGRGERRAERQQCQLPVAGERRLRRQLCEHRRRHRFDLPGAGGRRGLQDRSRRHRHQ